MIASPFAFAFPYCVLGTRRHGIRIMAGGAGGFSYFFLFTILPKTDVSFPSSTRLCSQFGVNLIVASLAFRTFAWLPCKVSENRY